jgi:hypothetical protein
MGHGNAWYASLLLELEVVDECPIVYINHKQTDLCIEDFVGHANPLHMDQFF